MIDYNKTFEEAYKDFEDIIQLHYEFKSKINKKNRDEILKKIKTFNRHKNKYTLALSNMNFGEKENKK